MSTPLQLLEEASVRLSEGEAKVTAAITALKTPAPTPTPTPTPTPPVPPGIVFSPGLNSTGTESNDAALAVELGAKTVRIPFEASGIAGLEAIIAAYRAKNVSVSPVVCFEGGMLTTAQIALLVALAKAEGPLSGKTCPVSSIEFGNETNMGYQYGNDEPADASYKERARTYAQRGVELAQALNGTDVGVLFQGSDGGTKSSVWVDEMFAAEPALFAHVAGWTIHPYPGGDTAAAVAAGDTWGVPMMERMVTQLEKHGDTTLPIHVTEWGVPSDNGVVFTSGQRFTYAEAAQVAETHPAKLKVAAKGRIGLFLIYGDRDGKPTGTSTNRESYFGVLQREGQAKGAYTEACKALLAS